MIRRAHKLDISQRNIVAALEGAGCSVADLSAAGGGKPDLIVTMPTRTIRVLGDPRGEWFAESLLMECKTPKADRCGVQWKYTPAQIKFRAAWKGRIVTVETPEEALRAVGVGV